MRILFAALMLFGVNGFGGNMSNQVQTAYLAGGCFWGVEDLMRKLPGVTNTDVGYTGGDTTKQSYEDVKTGTTGHAEAVKIEFDASKISYAEILDYFFRLHDPTTLNQQGNDKGSQYRSAIFFTNSEQEKEARAAIDRANKSGRWEKPVVTKLEAFEKFVKAEEYHQDYLVKHPHGYTCHWVRK